MNITRYFSALFMAAVLLPTSFAMASNRVAVDQVVSQSSASSGQVKVAPAKHGKRKSSKHYSKATLSAFQPIAQPAGTTAEGQTAAAIALSPVVNKQAVKPLSTSSSAASEPSAFALVGAAAYDEETSNAQHERITGNVGDSDALGRESVSVIDRFADKPKAKPLANGPLRVRMKDSGLKASVSIPLGAAQ